MVEEQKEEAEETEVVKKGPIPPIVAKIASVRANLSLVKGDSPVLKSILR